MGWHRDGHTSGEYIAHYFLGETDETDAPMSWCELALPELPLAETGEEELAYAISFDSEEVRGREGRMMSKQKEEWGGGWAVREMCYVEVQGSEEEGERDAVRLA